jgi:hypothetical protein
LDIVEKIASYLQWEERVEIACTCHQLQNVKTCYFIPPNSGDKIQKIFRSVEEGARVLVAGDQEVEQTLVIVGGRIHIKSAHLHAGRKFGPAGTFRFKTRKGSDPNEGLMLRGDTCKVRLEGLTIVNSEDRKACVTVSHSAFARIESCILTSQGCGNGIVAEEGKGDVGLWVPKTRVEVCNNNISDHKLCGLYVNGNVTVACSNNIFSKCQTTAIHRCQCASVTNPIRHQNIFHSNTKDLCLHHDVCDRAMSEPMPHELEEVPYF